MEKPSKKQSAEYLKKRVSIDFEGHKKCNLKKTHKDRINFGTSRCDSYGLSNYLGNLLANNLFQYCADANSVIIREDFKLIAKHAQSIRDYVNADSWDKFATTGKDAMTRMIDFEKKEKDWREAMFWLTENWQGLWW